MKHPKTPLIYLNADWNSDKKHRNYMISCLMMIRGAFVAWFERQKKLFHCITTSLRK